MTKKFKTFIGEGKKQLTESITPAQIMRKVNAEMWSGDILKLAVLCLQEIGQGRSSFNQGRIAQAIGLLTPLIKNQTNKVASPVTNIREGKNAEWKRKKEELLRIARQIVATGKCPECGNDLIRNNAMAGWWQCAGYATTSHRAKGHENDPKCSFQTFTE